MADVVAGVGMFELNSTHKLCTRCEHADLELQKVDYYANDCVGSQYKVVCTHMDACKNAYCQGRIRGVDQKFKDNIYICDICYYQNYKNNKQCMGASVRVEDNRIVECDRFSRK